MSVEVRKVTNSDKNDVLDISRHIWGGHDYLPSVLDDWLKDSSSNVFGVQLGSHIVAVANLRIIESGKIGWMEGLRVHPQHVGKGYANLLTEKLVATARNAGVQRLRYTTAIDNKASLKLAEKHGFARVFEMGVSWRARPKVKLLAEVDSKVKKSNVSEVYRLLKNNPHIVPHGILVYDWKALDFTVENLKEIGKSHSFYVSLKESQIDTLSFAYVSHRPDQLVWVFTVCSSDAKSVISHFSLHESLAQKSNCGAMMCTYKADFEEDLRKSKLISRRWNTHLVLLERSV